MIMGSAHKEIITNKAASWGIARGFCEGIAGVRGACWWEGMIWAGSAHERPNMGEEASKGAIRGRGWYDIHANLISNVN